MGPAGSSHSDPLLSLARSSGWPPMKYNLMAFYLSISPTVFLQSPPLISTHLPITCDGLSHQSLGSARSPSQLIPYAPYLAGSAGFYQVSLHLCLLPFFSLFLALPCPPPFCPLLLPWQPRILLHARRPVPSCSLPLPALLPFLSCRSKGPPEHLIALGISSGNKLTKKGGLCAVGNQLCIRT